MSLEIKGGWDVWERVFGWGEVLEEGCEKSIPTTSPKVISNHIKFLGG